MKLHVIKRGAVAALVLAGALVSMAGPAAALPGPIEDIYREHIEPLPGQIDEAIDNACETADCDGINEDIDNLEQGINEDIEFLTEELPCEQGLCDDIERVEGELRDIDEALRRILFEVQKVYCGLPGSDCVPEEPSAGPLCMLTGSEPFCPPQ